MRSWILTLVLVLTGCAVATADPILGVKNLYQNDYPDLIDSSSSSIAALGCTLTAYAMMFNFDGAARSAREERRRLNRWSVVVYAGGADQMLNDYRYEQPIYATDPTTGKSVKTGRTETKNGWGLTIGPDGKPQGSTTNINAGALLEVVKQASKKNSFENKGLTQDKYKSLEQVPPEGKVVDGNTKSIRDELDAGRPVLTRVENNSHTVLIIGWDPVKGFIIADPFRDDDGKSRTELNSYGNKVYELDQAIFKAGGLFTPFEVPSYYFIPLDGLLDEEINPELFGPQEFRANHVPEPSTFVLMLGGLGGVFGMRRRYLRLSA